jgi:DNA modification methylase
MSIPYYDKNGVKLYLGNCNDILPELEPTQISLLLSDPPYGCDYHCSHATSWYGGERLTTPDFGKDEYDSNWLKLVFPLMKTPSHLLCFMHWKRLGQLCADAESAGFKSVQHLIWNKFVWGMGDLVYPGSQTEDIVMFRKGRYKFPQYKRSGNIYPAASKAYFPEGCFDHPAQKPLLVLENWVQNFSYPNDLVCDPFMGSGSSIVAAAKQGRNAIGIDNQEKYLLMTITRLEKLAL